MPRRRILQVFNRYLHTGGEEKSVDRIHRHASLDHDIERCFFESSEWKEPRGPGPLGQLRRTWYNPGSARQLRQRIDEFKPDALLFHNVFPVGSPSLFHVAQQLGVPVIYYIHNFRPFSIGGSLYAGGEIVHEALHGNYWREVKFGVWQGSILKSAVMAVVLMRLHRSGWLRSVKAWVGISEFVRDRLIEAGVNLSDAFALRHSWDAMTAPPIGEDAHAYLYLGRLVDVKGVVLLLDAWHEIAAKLGAAAPELWIGGEGPLEAKVREAATRNPKIQFHGLVDGTQKRELIRRCRAMIAPSIWYEPLGLVTYEAYDFCKPMLAAESGGLMETVVPGVTGDLFKRGDKTALVDAVLRFESLSDHDRKTRGQTGRQWLLENTNVSAWRERFSEIVEHAVGPHSL